MNEQFNIIKSVIKSIHIDIIISEIFNMCGVDPTSDNFTFLKEKLKKYQAELKKNPTNRQKTEQVRRNVRNFSLKASTSTENNAGTHAANIVRGFAAIDNPLQPTRGVFGEIATFFKLIMVIILSIK